MNWEILWKAFPTICKAVKWITGRKPNRGTVLIIEDNPADALLLEYSLRKLNYDCQIAESAEVANGFIRAAFFSVIFVDLRLPGLSREALLRVLSTDSPNARLVVVCGEPADLHSVEPGRPIIMIRKPVNVRGLVELFQILSLK